MDILFWRHATPSQKKKGTCTLYLRITVNGTREELGSTGLRIDSTHWNEGTQRITLADPLASFKNEQIGLIEIKLWAIHNELLRKGQGLSASRIRRAYTLPDAVTYLFAFEEFQKVYEKRTDIASSSKKTLKNIKQLAVRFLIESKLAGVLVEEFTGDVMDDYRSWCKSRGYKESYIVRSARAIAQIPKFARKKKWISSNPLEGYVIGHEKIVRPAYVDSLQLAKWHGHSFLHPTAQKVADLFVLYARTGFHYKDLVQVIKKPTDFIMIGIDGKQWICKPRQKTEIEAKVPIEKFPEIRSIVEKYGGWRHVPTFSNSKMNDWLKICVAEINLQLVPAQRIHTDLSVKHGRSSFCDFCLNELGLTRESLLTMMGRVSAAELERYVRSDERGVITAFKISEAALAS